MTEKKSSGIKGGARPGAGRKKGSPNKKTAELQAKVEASGVTPLEFMLSVMRAPAPRRATVAQKLAHTAMCFDAARAAAPYVHPKLASVEHYGTGDDGAIVTDNTITIKLVKPGQRPDGT